MSISDRNSDVAKLVSSNLDTPNTKTIENQVRFNQTSYYLTEQCYLPYTR